MRYMSFSIILLLDLYWFQVVERVHSFGLSWPRRTVCGSFLGFLWHGV